MLSDHYAALLDQPEPEDDDGDLLTLARADHELDEAPEPEPPSSDLTRRQLQRGTR